MKPFFCVVVIIITLSSGAAANDTAPPKAGDLRFMRVYDGVNQTGVNYEYTENSPDLSMQGMDNIIESSHSTGLWLLYDETDFRSTVCHLPAIDFYFNSWDSACRNMVSSLRYAGSPYGLNDNYYNLYDLESLGGEELGGNTDMESMGSFDSRTSSLALTGQSEWTLYTGQGYTGASVCVIPTKKVSGTDGTVMNYAFYDKISDIGLPDNSIRSIARGCITDPVVGAPRLNKTTHSSL